MPLRYYAQMGHTFMAQGVKFFWIINTEKNEGFFKKNVGRKIAKHFSAASFLGPSVTMSPWLCLQSNSHGSSPCLQLHQHRRCPSPLNWHWHLGLEKVQCPQQRFAFTAYLICWKYRAVPGSGAEIFDLYPHKSTKHTIFSRRQNETKFGSKLMLGLAHSTALIYC